MGIQKGIGLELVTMVVHSFLPLVLSPDPLSVIGRMIHVGDKVKQSTETNRASLGIKRRSMRPSLGVTIRLDEEPTRGVPACVFPGVGGGGSFRASPSACVASRVASCLADYITIRLRGVGSE